MTRDLIHLLKATPKSPPRPPVPARLGAGLRTDPLDPDDPFTRQPTEVQRLLAEVASSRPNALTAEATTEGLVLHLWENAGEGLFTHRSLRVNTTQSSGSPIAPPPARSRSGVLGLLASGMAFMLAGAGLLAGGWYGNERLRPLEPPTATPNYRAEIDALTSEIRARRNTIDKPVQVPAPQPIGRVRYKLNLTVTGTLKPDGTATATTFQPKRGDK